MRGIIRKAMLVDSWVWIIVLLLFLVVFYFSFSLPEASGISRAELNELKHQESTARKNIGNLDEDILKQRELIRDNNENIEQLKIDLRNAKNEALNNWNGSRQIIESKKLLNDANELARERQDKLFELLSEKSDNIKLLKELSLEIDNSHVETISDLNLVKKIGVELDNTLITMIKNNITTPVTYKDLITLDSSNTEISGKFTTDENGFFYRDKPVQKNSWRLYDFDEELRVFIDPPKGMNDKIKLITIQQNFDTYFDPTDMTVEDEYEIIISNRTETLQGKTRVVTFENRTQTESFGMVVYHDRWIDKKCHQAKINADKVVELLADTINLMRNNCDRSHTSFDEREVIRHNSTVINLSESPNWNLLQELERVKEFCIFKFKAC